jgi:predicted kinase
MECAILVGLPGSGKTTFYRARLAATHVHVSKDELPRGANKVRRQQEALEAALARGESVAVDNTNPTVADRAPIIAAARACGAAVVCYVFESDPRASLARNATREGRAKVPPVAIFAIAKRLQPPTRAEGFDAIHRVRIAGDGRFEVEAIA